MDPKKEKVLLNKLRRAVQISYISKYIIREELDKTQDIINDYINKGVIKESEYAKGYYELVNQK